MAEPLLSLNTAKLIKALEAAVMRAVERTAVAIEADAKHYAPVRKVFDARHGKMSMRRMPVLDEDKNVRWEMQRHYSSDDQFPVFRVRVPGPFGGHQYRSYGGDRHDLRQTMHDPVTGKYRLRNPIAEEFLTRGGRNSGRRSLNLGSNLDFHIGGKTINSGGGVDPMTGRLGGRLRRQIHATAVTRDGTRFGAGVESPTPYAIYQELGTAHNKAHPFLRPALQENERTFVENLKAELANPLESSGRHRTATLNENQAAVAFLDFIRGVNEEAAS